MANPFVARTTDTNADLMLLLKLGNRHGLITAPPAPAKRSARC